VQPLLTRENDDDAAIDGDTRSISDTFGDDINKRVIHEIDTQLKEIHAINNYGKVKDERDLLEKKLNHALILHKEASDEIKKLTEGMKGYIETLEQLSRAEEEIAKLRRRIGELEQLKFILPEEEGSNKTNNIINSGGAAATDDKLGTKKLLEVEKMFLNSKEEEIKKRAAELFNSKKEEWERTEKPRLVSERAAQALKQMIDTLSSNDVKSSIRSPSTSPSASSPIILPVELQERLNSIIQAEVQRRVDSGFIEPKAEELRRMISANVFAALQGPWDVPCRICRGMHIGMWLSYEEVASLIHDGDLVLECVENYNIIRPVTDIHDNVIGLLSQRRFKLRLADLISLKLSSDE
jgi:hypothetical protein